MNDENITIMSLEDAILQADDSEMDWDRIRREKAAGIEPDIDPDEGEFDSSQTGLIKPPPKTTVSIQLDVDVLTYFKEQGDGCHTRINAVLRKYMKENRKTDRAPFSGGQTRSVRSG